MGLKLLVKIFLADFPLFNTSEKAPSVFNRRERTGPPPPPTEGESFLGKVSKMTSPPVISPLAEAKMILPNWLPPLSTPHKDFFPSAVPPDLELLLGFYRFMYTSPIALVIVLSFLRAKFCFCALLTMKSPPPICKYFWALSSPWRHTRPFWCFSFWNPARSRSFHRPFSRANLLS